MKKLTIALFSGMMSMSGWAACIYNFDATEAQIKQANVGTVPPVRKFPILNTNTGAFTLENASYQYLASTSAFVQSLSNYINGASNTITGDKNLSNNGRYVVELKINNFSDIPIGTYVGTQSGVFTLGYNFYGIKNGNLKYGGFLWVTNSDQTKTKKVFISFSDLETGANYGKEYEISYNIVNNYIIGLYFDQDTKQIGINLNGIDKGFVNNVPLAGSVSQISFQMFGLAGGYPTTLPNTFQPSETIIFDASQMSLNYSTNSKDICGNTL